MTFFFNFVISFLICRAFLVLHRTTPFNQLFYLISSSCLHWTILQDSLATPNVCQIILLAPGYLNLLPCMEPAESLTILCGSTSEPRSWEAKTIQSHLLLPLPYSNRRLKLKFALEIPSLAASSQPCFLLLLQLRVGQKILFSNPARLHTRVCLHSIIIYYYSLDKYLIYKQPRTWWQLSGAQQ